MGKRKHHEVPQHYPPKPRCVRCGQAKKVSEMTKVRGKVGSWCVACRREYMKAWRQEHRERLTEYQQAWRKR